jgi:hypothetical protein
LRCPFADIHVDRTPAVGGVKITMDGFLTSGWVNANIRHQCLMFAEIVMSSMTLQERIERSLAWSKDAVFVRTDFDKFGGYDQVGRALRDVMKKGLLVKAGYGVYVKARASGITGKSVPVLSLIEIGLQALSKLGVEAEVGRSAKAYMAGKTTQMPMATVVNVGRSRVSRKIGFGKQSVRYER